MSLFKRRFLFEADDDNTEAQDQSTSEDNNETDNTPEEDTAENEEETSEEDTEDEGQEESDEEQTEETPEDDTQEEEDYSIDSDPDEETEDETSEDSDNSEEDTTDDSSTESEEKELDRELFNSLTEDEKKRKVETLKRLFMDLYSNCDGLVNKFNQISDDNDDFSPVIKRILSTLYDLKEYISYYIINVYNNKSYIENDINFNRYLSVLNGIKLVVEELEKSKEDSK